MDDIITHLPNRANILYDEYLDQGTALPGSLREKKNAQLSAIARDEETAIIEAEREKNSGPEADHDISMGKLRDILLKRIQTTIHIDFTLSVNHRAHGDVHDWARGSLNVSDMKTVNERNDETPWAPSLTRPT
ncbi:hypothetical protein H0G86_009920 [Trichoderma simmonsii]|uniref:Uncharacterized protein n=1 Tax=Trichoderma simmonsii TaxID=1491479 RepID=A0A8G0LIH3_9HYPO|nr:hypothetical protein H0G86_009920 [Trichoderma simmonsii]